MSTPSSTDPTATTTTNTTTTTDLPGSHCMQDHGAPNPYIIASSALLFLPAIRSFWTQSLLITLVWLGAALSSTMYHAVGERSFGDLDSVFAILAIITAFILLAALAMCYSVLNWRIIVPVVFGFAGIFFYLFEGCRDKNPSGSDAYVVYHSLWHVCIALAALSLSWTPLKLGHLANASFSDMGRSLFENTRQGKH